MKMPESKDKNANRSSSNIEKIERIKKHIKAYPDFPKKGILFRDFFPLFQNPQVLRDLVDVLLTHFRENLPQTQVIIGLESRGFLIGPLISYHLNIPFVPIRKAGKLPGDVKKMKYQLEYGSDVFEVQTESINEGARCVLVDDLLATGGSLKTAADLIKECKGVVLGAVVIIELDDLKGREKVKPLSVHSITHF